MEAAVGCACTHHRHTAAARQCLFQPSKLKNQLANFLHKGSTPNFDYDARNLTSC